MIFLNPNQQSVSANGKSSHLTPKDFQILHFLMSHPGCTFSPEEIFRHTRQEEPFEVRPIISVHIRHIRERIEVNPSRPCMSTMIWDWAIGSAPEEIIQISSFLYPEFTL